MKALAAEGAPEGMWLRAERQTAGRGRGGRTWASPPGNLYASTLVRLRESDPPPPTLALVAGVALYEAVLPYFRHPGEGRDPDAVHSSENPQLRGPGLRRGDPLQLKWPNDLLVGPRKLAGVLLERIEFAVVIGIGVNLAHHPNDQGRLTTSIAAEGRPQPTPENFINGLAKGFADSLTAWREDLEATRNSWLAAAHPIGTPLATHGPTGEFLTGAFDGLDPSGACRFRSAEGGIRLIHAGDVFMI